MRLPRTLALLIVVAALLGAEFHAVRAETGHTIYLPQISTPLPQIVLSSVNTSVEIQLYVGRVNGYGLTQLTSYAEGQGENDSPLWSPAGDRIAFRSTRDGAWRIYLMRPDGSGQTRLTSGAGGDETPTSWSPDGQQLLFFRGRQLFTIGVDGRNERALPSNATDASWGPDSAQLLYIAPTGKELGGNVYRINGDGSGQQLITSTTGLTITDVLWSPDGKRMALGVNNDQWGITGSGQHDFLITDMDGGNTVVLPGAFNTTWSPDGKRIAYSNLTQVLVADRDGSNPLEIARKHAPDIAGQLLWAGEWSRDGSLLAYRSSGRFGSDIVVVRSDGTSKAAMIPLPDNGTTIHSLSWGP